MASDVFLKIDGIDGESQDSTHTQEIEVLSWGWSESQESSGRAAGKVHMGDLQFAMETNTASPYVMHACALGTVFAEAVLTCRRATGDKQEYLVITLSNVYVTSFNTSGSGEGAPIDSVSLYFEKISYMYTSVDGNNVEVGWDVPKNEKI